MRKKFKTTKIHLTGKNNGERLRITAVAVGIVSAVQTKTSKLHFYSASEFEPVIPDEISLGAFGLFQHAFLSEHLYLCDIMRLFVAIRRACSMGLNKYFLSHVNWAYRTSLPFYADEVYPETFTLVNNYSFIGNDRFSVNYIEWSTKEIIAELSDTYSDHFRESFTMKERLPLLDWIVKQTAKERYVYFIQELDT